jgi:protein O-mannosyl-transferase
MATRKKIHLKEEKLLNWKILFLIVVSFLAYYPVMSHDFVNWDDIVYIMNNNMITAFSWVNLKNIFSSYFMGNYHPFILMSFSFDFHFFKFSAPGYHVHNLILHLVNTVLVYAFIYLLLKKNSNVAAIVALLFAVHPMHVESVAWISERKDVLYTAYFLLSLISYLLYREKGKTSQYFMALLFFVFSCLSKAQAVTLPIVLLLIDYLETRKFEWKTLINKIPFLILSLIFGVVAIFAQKTSNYVNPLGIPVFQSLFYAPYSLWIYILKFLAPIGQTAVYEYPVTPEGTLPSYIYLSPVIFLILVLIVWKTWKSYKYVTFGLLFFLVTIFPVLQFLPVGATVVAERYTYIPYIGLSVIAAIAFWNYREKSTLKNRRMLDYSGMFILLFMAVLTWNRTLIWKDSIALWTDVLDKNPRCAQAYLDRAFIYNEQKEYDKAAKDLSEGIKIDPDNKKKLNFYAARAFIYKKMGNYELALSDFSNAIKQNPGDAKAYFDRGVLYTDHFGKYDSGVIDFKKFLRINPSDTNGNFNLGIAYYKQNYFDSAKIYFLKSIEINQANGQAHSLLTNIYFQDKDYISAYRHGVMAQTCGVIMDNAVMNFLKNESDKNNSPKKQQ